MLNMVVMVFAPASRNTMTQESSVPLLPPHSPIISFPLFLTPFSFPAPASAPTRSSVRAHGIRDAKILAAAPATKYPVLDRVPIVQGPIIIKGQVAHSLTAERLEVVQSLDDWAGDELMKLLKPVEKCWQPQDLLPEPQVRFEQIYEDKGWRRPGMSFFSHFFPPPTHHLPSKPSKPSIPPYIPP